MKISDFKSSSILINWGLSYLSILLIPIIISGVVYFESGKILEREISNTNSQLLNQVSNAIDSRLKDIEKIGMELSFNKNIKGLLDQDTSIETLGSYNAVIGDLSVYKISNSFIDDLFIYLPNSHSAISSSTYLTERYFYDRLVYGSGADKNQWKEIVRQGSGKGFTPVFADKGNIPCKAVVYTRPLLAGMNKSLENKLMITIESSKLLDSITGINTDSKSGILIVDNNDNVISSNFSKKIDGFIRYNDITLDKGIRHIKIGSEKYTILYTTSDITGWKYISVIPTSVFISKTYYIKKLTVMSIVLSVLMGMVFILLFIKKNYNPMEKLISVLSTSSGLITDKKINEFKFIQEAIDRTLIDKHNAEKNIKYQNRILRSNKLVELLKGKSGNNLPVSQTLSDFGITFNSDDFLIMLIYIDKDSSFFTKTDDLKISLKEKEKEELARFVVSNVMEELLCRSQYALSTEVDEMVACIINLKDLQNTASLREYLVNILEEARETICGKFNIYFKVAASSRIKSVSLMPEAFREALEMLEYNKVMDVNELYFTESSEKRSREYLECQYYYPLQVEHRLINHVKVGDCESAVKLLDEIYEKNLLNSAPPLLIVKCLMFNLTSTLIKTLYEISGFCDKSFLEELDPVNSLMNCQTVFDMKKRLAVILEEVCKYIEGNRKNEHRQINELAINFIEKNYKDSNLNVSMVAENLGITPAYLSKLFKEQTGQVLLDYINNFRIKAAKELMKSRNCNISDIASQVGFYNSNTFIRIFKKYEGITPGKYKDSNDSGSSKDHL